MLLKINLTRSNHLNSSHKLGEQPWAKILHLPMPTFFWREDVNFFFVILNNHNPSIKLKSTLSVTAVDFLYTTTFKGPEFQVNFKPDIKVFFVFCFPRRKMLTLCLTNPVSIQIVPVQFSVVLYIVH